SKRIVKYMKSLEEVIIENKNLILKLASKYSRYYSIEDLYQVGIIGIIKAYDHYNKESNSKFSTYAYKYILGEMIDYIRKDRNIIVSEEYFKIYKKYLEVRRLLETKLNREVTLKEISDFIGISEEEIVRILEYVSFTKSIDKEISYEYYVDERENIDTKIYLEALLDSLDNFDRNLIDYRYYQGYTQLETADMLGVTQVKVSRQEKLILQRIKNSILEN
ncbi:MAG: sigma-70 family RNA polymerase sigma factor, partial [Bacilli bacterium]|nr:sigma-70 family RNA polymerase sigma factor [Bacilli bacterium]